MLHPAVQARHHLHKLSGSTFRQHQPVVIPQLRRDVGREQLGVRLSATLLGVQRKPASEHAVDIHMPAYLVLHPSDRRPLVHEPAKTGFAPV